MKLLLDTDTAESRRRRRSRIEDLEWVSDRRVGGRKETPWGHLKLVPGVGASQDRGCRRVSASRREAGCQRLGLSDSTTGGQLQGGFYWCGSGDVLETTSPQLAGKK